MASRGEGRFDYACARGPARRRRAGQGAGPRRLHQRGTGAADTEIAAGLDEGRSGLAGLVGTWGDKAYTGGLSKSEVTMSRPPLPPFTRETAAQKARLA